MCVDVCLYLTFNVDVELDASYTHLFLICCPLTFPTSVFICMDTLGNINGVPLLPTVDFSLLIISGYLCGSFSFTPAPIFFFPYKSLAYRGSLSTGGMAR